jgi:PAS domain S-box-containing protein
MHNMTDVKTLAEGKNRLLIGFLILAVLSILLAVSVTFISVKVRYQAETRHLVEVLRADLQSVIEKEGTPSEKIKKLVDLVEKPKWEMDEDNNPQGYFFMWKGRECVANGRFSKCNEYYNKAIEAEKPSEKNDKGQTTRIRFYEEELHEEQRKGLDNLNTIAKENLENEIQTQPTPEDFLERFLTFLGIHSKYKYVDYLWPKGKVSNENSEKIGFAIYILNKDQSDNDKYKEFKDWWIGTGVYTDHLLQYQVLAALGVGVPLMAFLSFCWWWLKQRLPSFVLDMVPEAILITNREFKVESANHAAIELFGYEKDGMKGLDVMKLVPKSQHEDFKVEMDSLADSGQTVEKYHVARWGKGEKPLRIHSRIVQLSNGNRLHAIYDMTKSHQLDLLTAGAESSGIKKTEETILCVQINFDELTKEKDVEFSTYFLLEYGKIVDRAIDPHGVRVELPTNTTRAKFASYFPNEKDIGLYSVPAAVNLLRSLLEWKCSKTYEILKEMEIQIFLRRLPIAISDKAALHPTASGKELADNLSLLDTCPYNTITLSSHVYEKARLGNYLEEYKPGYCRLKSEKSPLNLKIKVPFKLKENFTEVETYQLEIEQGQIVQKMNPAEQYDGKKLLRYFVSYEHKEDGEMAMDLLGRLATRLKLANGFRFEKWIDKDIPLGRNWDNEIQKAIENCDFGLFLISHNALASDYISDKELPRFLSSKKGFVPVALKHIDFSGKTDLKGLEERQIFLHYNESYDKQSTGVKKDDFIQALFDKIFTDARSY